MNCLKYVLQNYRDDLNILYNGDHIIAFGEDLFLDYKSQFKATPREMIYILLEKSHDKKTVERIFELTEEESKILESYYDKVRKIKSEL